MPRTRRDPDPSTQKETSFSELPENVPVDYFEPGFFNNELSVEEKCRRYPAGAWVGLPALQFCEPDKWGEWKNMGDDEFMQKYGEAVLAQYTMPTDEERERLREYDTSDDDADDEAMNLDGV